MLRLDSLKNIAFNRKGVASWLLSQMGLLIAGGFLIASIVSLSFYSDWRKEAEIGNIASQFVFNLHSVDLKEFNYTMAYSFPQKNFSYNVFISPYYIEIARHDGKWKREIKITKDFILTPVIRPSNWNCEWRNGKEMSRICKEKGVEYIEDNITDSNYALSLKPFEVEIQKPLFIEKVFVGGRSYVILYQR